jgi:hypothetical protein
MEGYPMGGFTATKGQGNNPNTGQLFNYGVNAAHATLLAPGDVIKITGESNIQGFGEVNAAAATGTITGIISGVEPIYAGEQLSETGLPASTEGTVYCITDRDLLFDVDVANGPLAATTVGLNANTVVTAATKVGGLTVSNMALNATGAAATATFQWRIVRLLEDEDGVMGNRATVRMNATTGTAGQTGV